MVKDALNRPQQGLEIHKTVNVQPSEIKERAAVRNCSLPSTNRRRRRRKKKIKKRKRKTKKYIVCSVCGVAYCRIRRI